MHRRSHARAAGLCCALLFLPRAPLGTGRKNGCLVARCAVEWRSIRPRRIPLPRRMGERHATPLPAASCVAMPASCWLPDASAVGVWFPVDPEEAGTHRARHWKKTHAALSPTACEQPRSASAARASSSSELPTLRRCDHQKGAWSAAFLAVFSREESTEDTSWRWESLDVPQRP